MLKVRNLRPLYGLMIIGASWLMAGCGDDKPASSPATPTPSAGGGTPAPDAPKDTPKTP
jgi:hypothetical protein